MPPNLKLRIPSAKGRIVSEKIDLRPLSAHPAANEMLMLARGQLNRAFRSNGVPAPDPMRPAQSSWCGPLDYDDPAAHGVAHATSHGQDAFVTWSTEMPKSLAGPVLSILRQTHDVLAEQQETEVPRNAILTAYEYLLAQIS